MRTDESGGGQLDHGPNCQRVFGGPVNPCDDPATTWIFMKCILAIIHIQNPNPFLIFAKILAPQSANGFVFIFSFVLVSVCNLFTNSMDKIQVHGHALCTFFIGHTWPCVYLQESCKCIVQVSRGPWVLCNVIHFDHLIYCTQEKEKINLNSESLSEATFPITSIRNYNYYRRRVRSKYSYHVTNFATR